MKNSYPSDSSQPPHIPVMVAEVLKGFEGVHITTFYEGTLGSGGHARALLEAHPEIKRYVACDRDPEALAIAEATLAPWKEKVELIHGDFSELDQQLKDKNIDSVDGFFLI